VYEPALPALVALRVVYEPALLPLEPLMALNVPLSGISSFSSISGSVGPAASAVLL
jgi:hypothetical protein